MIRDARFDDAAAIQAIYAPIVRDTVTSFELEPPTADEIRGRIAAVIENHAWLVAEDQHGRVGGYAHAGRHRERAAYRWSVDTTIYVRADLRGLGFGTALYRALFERLAGLGYFRAFAGIVLPNASSVALHQSVGFEPVGIYRSVGFKHGAWHDVAWWQRSLRPLGPPVDGV